MNVLEMFSLKGKIALVTGGAGHQGGYGAQISEALYAKKEPHTSVFLNMQKAC